MLAAKTRPRPRDRGPASCKKASLGAEEATRVRLPASAAVAAAAWAKRGPPSMMRGHKLIPWATVKPANNAWRSPVWFSGVIRNAIKVPMIAAKRERERERMRILKLEINREEENPPR